MSKREKLKKDLRKGNKKAIEEVIEEVDRLDYIEEVLNMMPKALFLESHKTIDEAKDLKQPSRSLRSALKTLEFHLNGTNIQELKQSLIKLKSILNLKDQ